ncbi:hypothetical protein CVT24_005441 [Panaeolus cyanescens]|uniref:Uncharacterized protein n=1 Tax=Panaeolus cyanescens TaxID=181874 RepID=A0A409WGL0_9AGAR|nr:hypothetical protein CVT24_005441 [Panaeolus cyanescens]
MSITNDSFATPAYDDQMLLYPGNDLDCCGNTTFHPNGLLHDSAEVDHPASIPVYEDSNIGMNYRSQRRRNKRFARKAAKQAIQRRAIEDAPSNSTDLVVRSGGPPPPPPTTPTLIVDIPAEESRSSIPSVAPTPLTINEMRVTLYSLASALHIAVSTNDLIEVFIEDNQIAYAIDEDLTRSLWLSLKRFHSVVVQAAVGYATQQGVQSPFNTSMPSLPTLVPDDLFDRLAMPRPAILSKVKPTRSNPLSVAFTSAPLAVSAWNSYQRLAIDTMTWLASAYARSFNASNGLSGVSHLLRIEENEIAHSNNHALVLHPTASRYAQQHTAYNPYAGSVVLDATR